jgi:hypothetical protein
MKPLKARQGDRALNTMNILLGAALFLSPFLLGFTSDIAAAAHAWLSGALVGFVAFIALAELEEWEEWINLALGVWVIISPWLFGFHGVTHAMWAHVVLGAAVAIFAAAEIWKLHRSPPTTKA